MKLAILTLVAGVAQSCSKEEYAAKFGATYELLAAPAPKVIHGNQLVANVKYLSKCHKGGSVFEAVAKDLPTEMMKNFDVVLLSRKEPRCSNPGMFEVSYVEQVTVPLPTFPKTNGFMGKDLMIAFPPDGAYQIYKLQNAGQRSTVPLHPNKQCKRYKKNSTHRQRQTVLLFCTIVKRVKHPRHVAHQ
jgi:hypothetical protein